MEKILVADQEESLCLLYQEELTEEGYDVVGTSRSEEIVQAIIQEEKPDLLLLSIEMVEQGLWRLLYEMRKAGHAIPVILFTSYSYYRGFPEELINDTVMKSSNLDELKRKVKRILGEEKKLSSLNTPLFERKEERRSEEQIAFFSQK